MDPDLEADINLQGGVLGTPLRAAAFRGREDLVKQLFVAKALPNLRDNIRGSALGAALITNNAKVIRALLDGKVNIYAHDEIYGTALHGAAMNGQNELVELFLDAGVKPDIYGGLFGTAIEASAWGGHVATVELLLGGVNFKSNRYASRRTSTNAIYLASARGKKEALNLLMQKFKDLRVYGKLKRDTGGLTSRPGHSPSSSKSGEKTPERIGRREDAVPSTGPPKKRRPRKPRFDFSWRMPLRLKRRSRA